jgi:hypothetical protein
LFSSGHQVEVGLRDQVEEDDPQVGKQLPEVVLYDGRVFQVKNEKELDDDDGVEQQQDVEGQHHGGRELKYAKQEGVL